MGEEQNYPPNSSKTLELCWKLEKWHVRKNPYLVSENMPFSTKALLILLMSAFFRKQLAFFGQIAPNSL